MSSDEPKDLPPIVNRRQSNRQRVLLGGLIVTRDGTRTWDCSIKDLSETGAKIRLAEGQVIPEHCIFVNLKDGIAYQVAITWHRPPMVGLKFLETHHLQTLTDPKLQFARRLWQERRGR
jgi:hypothetical protein